MVIKIFIFILPALLECLPHMETLSKKDAKPIKANFKRCGNKDETFSTPGKTVYTWNFKSLPKGLTEGEFRQILHQAFTAYEVVIPVDFIEVNSSKTPDILVNFDESEKFWPNDVKRLTMVQTFRKDPFEISISKNEDWAVFEDEDPKFDLYSVLVHSLGHVLGLPHSTDAESVMYPILERHRGENPPTVSHDDVDFLRKFFARNHTIV